MFHMFSLVCFLVYSDNSRSGHDRSQNSGSISHGPGPKLCTSSFHLSAAPGDESINKAWQRSGPNLLRAAPNTCVVQSCRGRPILRTYLPINGVMPALPKVSRRSGWSAGLQTTLPRRSNCLFKSCCEKGATPAFCKTVALETLDMNAAGILRIRRRQRT